MSGRNFLAAFVVALAGVSASAEAQLWCYVGNSPQCRVMATCAKQGSPKAACECLWTVLSQSFPSEQHVLVAEFFEALPAKGASMDQVMESERRRMAIASKAGLFQFGLMIGQAMMHAEQKCGKM